MGAINNPALAAFLASFTGERDWAQVLVRRNTAGYELRHVSDRAAVPQGLTTVKAGELRKLSLFTTAGQFRPIKAAPDLRAGWRYECRDETELWRALQELYPGSIPDWYALQSGEAFVTHYREFTDRQTGMYRITQLLSNAEAGEVISACCPAQFCLKQRFWSVDGVFPDPPETKSAIPCLEPCAVFLELARKTARLGQEKKTFALSTSEVDSLIASLEIAIPHSFQKERLGDFGSPLNPRRLQLLLEKCRDKGKTPSINQSED